MKNYVGGNVGDVLDVLRSVKKISDVAGDNPELLGIACTMLSEKKQEAQEYRETLLAKHDNKA